MMLSYDIAIRLGLDGPGIMQGADNGLLRARRAHPAFRGRRSQNGTRRLENLPDMPGHIPMPPVGDDRPRSGVRSRRRRFDSGTTVGDETMNVREIAAAHREASIFVYVQHGRLHPKLWVESESVIILIEPKTWEACDISDWQKAQMLASARLNIDGTIIGRCDEVYIRDMTVPGAKKGEKENLAEMVDFDPSIRSALMVHSMDCVSGETYMTMATFDLDNEGLPFWERHEAESYYATFAVPLWASTKLARRDRDHWFLPDDKADQVASDYGWMMTRLQK